MPECEVCQLEIHKVEQQLFYELWQDDNGCFGLNEPYHWHTPGTNYRNERTMDITIEIKEMA